MADRRDDEPPQRGDRRDDEPPQRLADHLLQYLREPTLWPVSLVAVAIFATLGAAALLAALVQRNVFAIAALALLVGMTVDQVWRELRARRPPRPGVATALLAAFWLLSALVAFAAVRSGLF